LPIAAGASPRDALYRESGLVLWHEGEVGACAPDGVSYSGDCGPARFILIGRESATSGLSTLQAGEELRPGLATRDTEEIMR